MAKTVIPYCHGAHGEVFVRMMATGDISRRMGNPPGPLEVRVRANGRYPGGTPLSGNVVASDVVAMVVDDARYALIEPTARGTSATFETPEAAAQMLEGLGWRVEPPPAGRRAGVRYWHPESVGAHGEIADAHAEPIGEPFWSVRSRTSRASSTRLLEWVVESRDGQRVVEVFDHEHLAQACADDLNIHEEAK